MNDKKHFIIIDDDPASNIISESFLTEVFGRTSVKVFTDPWLGLKHLINEYTLANSREAVLFLDLNMPQMNGWEFLAHFDGLGEVIAGKVRIYILSSSIDQRDITRAGNTKHIVSFVSKPLNRQRIEALDMF